MRAVLIRFPFADRRGFDTFSFPARGRMDNLGFGLITSS